MTVFLPAVLVTLSGCSLGIYPTSDLSKDPQIGHMEFKSVSDVKRLFPNATFELKNDNTYIFKYNTGDIQTNIKCIDLRDEKTVSVKYHRNLVHDAPNVSVLLEFANSRKQPALLDTGFPVSILLTSDIVSNNQFIIYPLKGTGDTFQGICKIPKFDVGNIKVEDALAYYCEQQWQLRVLNIPVYKHPNIILGIDFIKSFDYVLFDNVNENVIFSKDSTFEPDKNESWSSYPFEIKPDSLSNDRIMVQIPVNGQMYRLFFDTCGHNPGLSLNQNNWETLSKKLTIKDLRKSHYVSWQSGKLPCRRAIMSKISIGEKQLKNAEVLIYNEPESLSMFSLGYFQDTVVVLDFVNNLFWVK